MDAKGLLGEHYSRNTKRLFKSFLILLEDLKTEHEILFCKLRKNLPQHKELIEVIYDLKINFVEIQET